MDCEGPLVPEESGGLVEGQALVDCALGDEVVEEGHTLGSKVAHTVAGDGEKVAVDLLHTTLVVIVLLLLTFLSSSTEPLSCKVEVSGEELVLDSEVNEGFSQS